MLTLRKADERGHANHGWLNTYHSFSFANYYDPQQMGFKTLRVINEDRIKGGMGFGTHSHRNMEIITYVLEGALAHKDSIGTQSTIKAGEVQIMSAGTGIAHSEFNASETETVHLLQIWILTNQQEVQPRYDQRLFTREDKEGKLKLIVSPDGRDDSIFIYQDLNLYATILKPGEKVQHLLSPDNYAWIQVVRGEASLNGTPIATGDGVGISKVEEISLEANSETEILLFDLG